MRPHGCDRPGGLRRFPAGTRTGARAGLRRRCLAALVGLLVGAGALAMVAPFAWMVSTSLKPPQELVVLPPRWWPQDPTAAAYGEVLRRFPLLRVVSNSFLVASVTAAGQLLVSATSGYAFGRLRFRGRDALFLLYLGTLMVPFAVTVTPLFLIVRALGWMDSYAGLIVPGMFSAFGTFLMRQHFQALPADLEEAAALDGAGTVRTFLHIVLPGSGPALATLGVLAFLNSWNSFLWPLLVVSDERYMTLPLALATLQGRYPGLTQWNLVMAGTVIAVVPVLCVFFLAQRWVVEGITASALKG